jgi:hypothetical protein
LMELSQKDLLKQRDLVEARIAKAKAEGLVTAEMEKQLAIINQIVNEKREGVTIDRIGAPFEQQSTASLEGLQNRLRSQLTQSQFEDTKVNSMFGGYISPATNFVRGELANIDRELSLRYQVQSVAQRYGETAAVRQFGDDVTSRALRDMKDVQTQTLGVLQEVNARLAGSGIFPRN